MEGHVRYNAVVVVKYGGATLKYLLKMAALHVVLLLKADCAELMNVTHSPSYQGAGVHAIRYVEMALEYDCLDAAGPTGSQ